MTCIVQHHVECERRARVRARTWRGYENVGAEFETVLQLFSTTAAEGWRQCGPHHVLAYMWEFQHIISGKMGKLGNVLMEDKEGETGMSNSY
jgi:hypothetical protein